MIGEAVAFGLRENLIQRVDNLLIKRIDVFIDSHEEELGTHAPQK